MIYLCYEFSCTSACVKEHYRQHFTHLQSLQEHASGPSLKEVYQWLYGEKVKEIL